MKCTLSIEALKALVVIAPKSNARYYLNGICIEFNMSITRAIAIDGHMLAVHETAATHPDMNLGEGEFIVPIAVVQQLLKLCSRVDYFLEFDISQYPTVTAKTSTGGALTFSAIAGSYPDWRRVFPAKADIKEGQFVYLNPALLNRAQLAGQKISSKCILRYVPFGKPNACDGVIFEIAELWGIIMAMRGDQNMTGFSDAKYSSISTPRQTDLNAELTKRVDDKMKAERLKAA
jgi:DNA polymerase III subunit beta